MTSMGSCPVPNPCAGVNCGTNGYCVNGVCQCTSGYSGSNCQTPPIASSCQACDVSSVCGSFASSPFYTKPGQCTLVALKLKAASEALYSQNLDLDCPTTVLSFACSAYAKYTSSISSYISGGCDFNALSDAQVLRQTCQDSAAQAFTNCGTYTSAQIARAISSYPTSNCLTVSSVPEPSQSNSSTAIIAGAAGGGGSLLFLLAFLWWRKRCSRSSESAVQDDPANQEVELEKPVQQQKSSKNKTRSSQ